MGMTGERPQWSGNKRKWSWDYWLEPPGLSRRLVSRGSLRVEKSTAPSLPYPRVTSRLRSGFAKANSRREETIYEPFG
jgi:hypothetical protein